MCNAAVNDDEGADRSRARSAMLAAQEVEARNHTEALIAEHRRAGLPTAGIAPARDGKTWMQHCIEGLPPPDRAAYQRALQRDDLTDAQRRLCEALAAERGLSTATRSRYTRTLEALKEIASPTWQFGMFAHDLIKVAEKARRWRGVLDRGGADPAQQIVAIDQRFLRERGSVRRALRRAAGEIDATGQHYEARARAAFTAVGLPCSDDDAGRLSALLRAVADPPEPPVSMLNPLAAAWAGCFLLPVRRKPKQMPNWPEVGLLYRVALHALISAGDYSASEMDPTGNGGKPLYALAATVGNDAFGRGKDGATPDWDAKHVRDLLNLTERRIPGLMYMGFPRLPDDDG